MENNLEYAWALLSLDWTDDLPYLEPWVGTGIYANAFGCEYLFREFEAPHVQYLCHSVEALSRIEYPDYRQSPIMRMVLDCIDALKDRTLKRRALPNQWNFMSDPRQSRGFRHIN